MSDVTSCGFDLTLFLSEMYIQISFGLHFLNVVFDSLVWISLNTRNNKSLSLTVCRVKLLTGILFFSEFHLLPACRWILMKRNSIPDVFTACFHILSDCLCLLVTLYFHRTNAQFLLLFWFLLAYSMWLL